MFDFYVPNNSMNIKIPYVFFEQHMELSWLDVYFGLQSNYISTSVAIEKALAQLAIEEDNVELISSIAISSESDVLKIKGYILELVDTKNFTNESLHNKWLYISLYYLYENRDDFIFPFEHSEGVTITSEYDMLHWLCSDFNERDYYMPDCLLDVYRSSILRDIMSDYSDEQLNELWKKALQEFNKLLV